MKWLFLILCGGFTFATAILLLTGVCRVASYIVNHRRRKVEG